MNWPGEKPCSSSATAKLCLSGRSLMSKKKKTEACAFSRKHGTTRCLSTSKMLALSGLKGWLELEKSIRGSIGSVTQMAYAVTCHKSQALELPAIVLHSSKEFVTGLVYIAMSRVRTQETLHMLGFKRRQVIPVDPEVIVQCNKSTGNCDPNLRCCRRKAVVNEAFFNVHDQFKVDEEVDVGEDYYRFPIKVSDGVVQTYFER